MDCDVIVVRADERQHFASVLGGVDHSAEPADIYLRSRPDLVLKVRIDDLALEKTADPPTSPRAKRYEPVRPRAKNRMMTKVGPAGLEPATSGL